MSGTDGTSSTTSVAQPGDQRRAERRPHPEGDDQGPFRLRSGDERQDRHELGVDRQQGHRRARTHSSGVARIWPAWTDAISSSVEAKSVAAGSSDVGLVRLRRPCRAAATRRPTIASTTGPDDRPSGRRPRTRPIASARPMPRYALIVARTTMTARRADGRHQDERDEQAAEDGAGRVRPRAASRTLLPASAARSRRSADAVGNAMPSTMVTGSTTSTRRPEQGLRASRSACRGRASPAGRGRRRARAAPAPRPRSGSSPAAGRGSREPRPERGRRSARRWRSRRGRSRGSP